MKKTLVLTLILLLSISLFGCTEGQLKPGGELQNQDPKTRNYDEETVNSASIGEYKDDSGSEGNPLQAKLSI